MSTGVAMGASTALSAGGNLLSGLTGSSSAGQAKSNAEDMGVANNLMFDTLMRSGTTTLNQSRDQAVDYLNQARSDSYNALVPALSRTDPLYDTWNQAGQTAANAWTSGGSTARSDYDTGYDRATGYLDAALAEWDAKYGDVKNYNKNYLSLGEQGVAGYSNLLSDPSSIVNNPGYQFRLNQGSQALDRSAAAKGQLFSGGAQAAQQQYGQDFATSEYDNALSRYGTAIGVGQNAVAQVDSAAMQTASGKSSVYNALANVAMQTASGKAGAALQTASGLSNSSFQTATGLTGLGEYQGNLYYNTGNALSGLNKSIAGTYQQSGQDTVNLWNNLYKQWANGESSSVSAENQATMNQSNALSQGIVGAGNSLTSGIGNYLYDQRRSSYGRGA